MAYTTSFVVAVCAVFASQVLVVQQPLIPGAEQGELQSVPVTASNQTSGHDQSNTWNSSVNEEGRENASASHLDEIRLEMCHRGEETYADWEGSNRTTPEWANISGLRKRAALLHGTYYRAALPIDNQWITKDRQKNKTSQGEEDTLLDLSASKSDGRRIRTRPIWDDDDLTKEGTNLLSILIDEYCLHFIIWAAAFTQCVAIVMPGYRLLVAFWRKLRNNLMHWTIIEDIVILDPFEFLHADVHREENDNVTEEVEFFTMKSETSKGKQEWTEKHYISCTSEISCNNEFTSTQSHHEHMLDTEPMKLAEVNDIDVRKNDDKLTDFHDMRAIQVSISTNLDFEDALKVVGSKKFDDLSDSHGEVIQPPFPTRTTSRLPNILTNLLRKKKTKSEPAKRKPILSIFRRNAKPILGVEEEVSSDIEELLRDCDACPDFSKTRLVFLVSAFV